MADETNRAQARLAIRNPDDPDNDDDVVWIPITVQIPFSDPKSQGQETVFKFNNGEESGRAVRVQEVERRVGSPTDYDVEEGTPLQVERIERLGVVDQKNSAQGDGIRFDCRDEADSWPALPGLLAAGEPAEKWRHVVRYTFDNSLDGVPWVDVELPDVFGTRDPKSDGQEHYYRLVYADRGPDIGDDEDPYRPTFAFCDMTLPIADANDSDIINPPYRMSPFENIVNYNFGPPVLAIALEASCTHAGQVPEFHFSYPDIPATEDHEIYFGNFLTPMYAATSSPLVFGEGASSVENPATKDMFDKLAEWQWKDAFATSTTGESDGDATKNVAWFVNLGPFSKKQPRVPEQDFKVTFTVEVPENGTVMPWTKWRLLGSYALHGEFEGQFATVDTFQEDTFHYFGWGREQLQLQANSISFDHPDFNYAITNEGPVPEYEAFFGQPDFNWKLTFSTYGGRKDFPLDDHSLPEWDVTKSASKVVKTQASSGPTPARTLLVTVNFSRGLELTVTG